MFLETPTNLCTDATFMVNRTYHMVVQSHFHKEFFISGSKEAGQKLLSMLKLGSSKPWKEVIEVMTGEPKMDTAAFREYFMPLENWLREENKNNGVTVGWKVKDFDHLCEGTAGGATTTTSAFLVTILLAITVLLS